MKRLLTSVVFAVALLLCTNAFAQSSVAIGSYECWYFSRPQSGLNFKLIGGGQYIDVEGKKGNVSLAGNQLTFRGGALDGETPLYEVRKGHPTVSFRRRGSEAAFCELAK